MTNQRAGQADIGERIAAQIAVANQVSPDGYWTMKAADGMAMLDLIAALRAERDETQLWVSALRVAIKVMDHTAQKEVDADGWITSYRFNTGAFHGLLGLLSQKATGERMAAELLALRSRLSHYEKVAHIVRGVVMSLRAGELFHPEQSDLKYHRERLEAALAALPAPSEGTR
jgi:hypothetical protein